MYYLPNNKEQILKVILKEKYTSMQKTISRYLLIGTLMLGAFFSWEGHAIASPAPITNEYAQVKAGEAAPLLNLPNLQGTNVSLVSKGKPTVIIAIHEFRIKRLADFQKYVKGDGGVDTKRVDKSVPLTFLFLLS
ncbi:MAG: hypothetical protein LLG02_06645 [Pelosinus sp.]|nr:hypothetical protein [Pelosinus sp.]